MARILVIHLPKLENVTENLIGWMKAKNDDNWVVCVCIGVGMYIFIDKKREWWFHKKTRKWEMGVDGACVYVEWCFHEKKVGVGVALVNGDTVFGYLYVWCHFWDQIKLIRVKAEARTVF